MGFRDYMIQTAADYGKKGELWSRDLLTSYLEAGVDTVEGVQAVMVTLTAEMRSYQACGEFGDYTHAWSKRDRFEYMLINWARYQRTGK